MKITVNGKITESNEPELTLSRLLAVSSVADPATVSVQVNGSFVPADQYSVFHVKEGDEVEFLYFLGGGSQAPGFSTRSVQGRRPGTEPTGSLRFPVYDNAAFEFASAEDLEDAFKGRKKAHSYSRISNPTVAEFEERLTLLSGGRASMAFSSGMAAISHLLMTICGTGDNVIVSPFLFGNTFSLIKHTLKQWGLEVRTTDLRVPEDLKKLADSRTRAVLLECITNPQLAVFDLDVIAAITRDLGVPFLLDNTAATPYLLNTKELGADVELLSTTKYITGGATSIGGALIDNGTFPWQKIPYLEESARKSGPFALISRLRMESGRNLGGCMAPHTAYLQTLGLETMELRIDRSSSNALKVAESLELLDSVVSVNYPGLRSSPWHETALRIFKRGFGGILTFRTGCREKSFKVLNTLKMIRRATNINDNKSLAIHPASTIFCEYSPAERETMGVPDDMIRLSVGIEDVDDIVADLEQALTEAGRELE